MMTNDDELAKQLRMIANHGQSKKYYHDRVGCNSRLDNIQAAILRIKLRQLDTYIYNRQKAAAFYDKHFESESKLKTPVRITDSDHVFHQYTLQLDDSINRDDLISYLKENGIPAMVYYPVPAHLQKMFSSIDVSKGDLSHTEWLTTRVISLPMHTELTEKQQLFIVNHIKKLFKYKFMNIAVVGTGYVGLVTGTCLAETGNNVICVDVDENKVNKLKSGEIPIYEPHLDVFFERNLKQNRLSFTTSLEEGVKDAELIFLALPTPPGEDGSADLSYVLGVADHLGKIIDDYKVIIDKSTVPVGTAEKVKLAVNKNAKVDFDVVSNPEFLREGFAVNDFMKPDRVVVGTSSEKAEKINE